MVFLIIYKNYRFCNDFYTFCKGWDLAPFCSPGTLPASTPVVRAHRHKFRRRKKNRPKNISASRRKTFWKKYIFLKFQKWIFENFRQNFGKSRFSMENPNFRWKIEISILIENHNENPEKTSNFACRLWTRVTFEPLGVGRWNFYTFQISGKIFAFSNSQFALFSYYSNSSNP